MIRRTYFDFSGGARERYDQKLRDAERRQQVDRERLHPDEIRERARYEAERPQREAMARVEKHIADALEDRRQARIRYVRELAKIPRPE